MKNDCATMDNDEQQIIAAIEKRYGKEIPYGNIQFFLVDGKVDHFNENRTRKIRILTIE
jgi:hypothetical protein